jgi:quercetin dioxygenase-like cupin family protein
MVRLHRKGYSVVKAIHEDIQEESIGIYYTAVPKRGKVVMHYHPRATEILIFLSRTKVKVTNREHVVEYQDVLILEPGERHEIYGPSKLIAIKIPDIEGDKVVC